MFTEDLLLLPIFGNGIEIQSLGPTLFNYHQLWMEFDYHGLRVYLHRLRNPPSRDHISCYFETQYSRSTRESIFSSLSDDGLDQKGVYLHNTESRGGFNTTRLY